MRSDDQKNGETRLDSWKAIAAYLGRDERTVQRWERTLGLPVRRLPGGRGKSVFAYRSEIDAWLRTRSEEQADVDVPSTVAAPDVRRAVPRRWMFGAAAAVAIGAIGAAWTLLPVGATDLSTLQIHLAPAAVTATAGEAELWRHAFPAGERVTVPDERQREPAQIVAGARPEIIVASSLRVRTRDEFVRSGELMAFTPAGDLRRRLTLDDRVRFGRDEYGAPWGITDFRVQTERGSGSLALAAHHYRWWPSLVTVLDSSWRRTGTFVNAGWLERVHWLSADRIVVAGFSESRDGGVVGLLDAQELDGQSPEDPGTRFFCTTCGPDRPVRYVALPRSELNRVSGSRFNRARLQLDGARIVVRTIEVMQGEVEAADAVYEFSQELRLLSARYSARYWEMHAALEAQGRIRHSRDECPDRAGPGEIHVWELATGWRTLPSPAL